MKRIRSKMFCRRIATVLCLCMCMTTLFSGALNRAYAIEQDGDLRNSVYGTGVTLSVFNDGKLGVLFYFNGSNKDVFNKGYVLVDDTEYKFVWDQKEGQYYITYYLAPKNN